MRRRPENNLLLPGIDWFEPALETAAAALAPEPADLREREAALDPRRSFIVQAPAGSGKTEVLIQRYLTLLTRVESPENIVAITFTVKAAGEMRGRILEALAAASRGEIPDSAHRRATLDLAAQVLERDRRLNWQLLSYPARLRVETIDALCGGIARQMPWTARLGAMPGLIEDAEELYREAAERTVGLLDDDSPEIAGAVATLLAHVDNDVGAAEASIARMLAQRDQWLRVLGTGVLPDEARPRIEAALARVVAKGLRRVAAAVPSQAAAELARLAHFASCCLDAGHDFTALPAGTPDCLEKWQWISGLLLTDKGDWRKRPNKSNGFPSGQPETLRIRELLESFSGNEEFRSALCGARKLPSPRFSDEQWEVLRAAVTLLPRSAAMLKVVFAEHGHVDFAEIAMRAHGALGAADQPTDLALALGSRIEHLLVDEFQDTSALQFILLERLTAGWEPGDGRTLFLVGDPMQSIYRFREADVGLFLQARQYGIGDIAPEPLLLASNFRSSPALVEWVNEAFTKVFPAEEHLESGAVAYSASIPFRPGAMGQAVNLHPLFGRDDSAEARKALAVIQAERAENPAASIAVLVRARTHLPELATLLRENGIPFRAVEIETLGNRPVVQDLLALTRALLHRADRVAWLAILRAPYCGLTLADLHAIATQDRHGAIPDLLVTPCAELSAGGRERLGRVVPILEEALARVGRTRLRALVEWTWVRLGGPQCLKGEADSADAAAFLDLLETSERGGDLPSLHTFAARVDKLFAEPDPQAGETLQLMTVHKAKGLEFDTVVVPGLGRATRHDDPQLLVWVERNGPEGPELLISPTPPRGRDDAVFRFVSRIEREKCDHESARLLYVACTRAKRRLHLIGATRCDEEAMGTPEMGSLLHTLWPAVEAEYRNAWEQRRAAPGAEPPAQPVPHVLRRVPAGWTAPEWPAPVVLPRRPSGASSASDAEPFSGVEAVFRASGTVLHRLLAQFGREGLDAWTAARVHAVRPAVEHALAAEGVPAPAIAATAEELAAVLCGMLGSERARWIFAPHAEAENELALSGVVDGTVYHAVIDRTFVDAGGTRWIIDYKSGSPQAGASQAAFLHEERERYRTQLERYGRLTRAMEERPVMLALFFPACDAWIEWPLAG